MTIVLLISILFMLVVMCSILSDIRKIAAKRRLEDEVRHEKILTLQREQTLTLNQILNLYIHRGS